MPAFPACSQGTSTPSLFAISDSTLLPSISLDVTRATQISDLIPVDTLEMGSIPPHKRWTVISNEVNDALNYIFTFLSIDLEPWKGSSALFLLFLFDFSLGTISFL